MERNSRPPRRKFFWFPAVFGATSNFGWRRIGFACGGKAPSSNIQAPEKLQASSFKRAHQRGLSGRCAGSTGGLWRDLELVWSLEVLWCLDLGGWSFCNDENSGEQKHFRTPPAGHRCRCGSGKQRAEWFSFAP